MGSIKDRIKRWKAHCRYIRAKPHPMHLEVPTKRAFNTSYSGKKGSLISTGDVPDLGPVSGRDYESLKPVGVEEIAWPSKDEIEDDEESRGASLADV